MKKFILFFVISFAPGFAKGNIIDILEQKDSSFSLQKQLKKDIGSVFVNQPVSFIQAFESQNFEKALEIWQKSIQSAPFAKSETGSALYAYLLFKNGFEALSLSWLLTNSEPHQMGPIVSRLWKLNIDKGHPVWDYFYFPIQSDWQSAFSPETVFKIGSKASIHLIKDQEYMKSLLRLTLKETWDVFSIEWLFVLSLIQKKDMDSSAKLLAWLLSKTKDKYRRDQINLTIARLLADIGETQASLHYYKKIKNLSYFWLLAQEEMSWLYLGKANYQKAYSTAMAFNYPAFLTQLSPSMYVVMALSQLKNCDDKGAVQSLASFRKAFLNQSSKLKRILSQEPYKSLIDSLLDFYSSNSFYYQIGKTDLFYNLRKDSRLKSDVLFYNYIKTRRQSRKTKFKQLLAMEDEMIESLENKIHARIEFFLKRELKKVQSALSYFHLIMAEVLYREYGAPVALSSGQRESWFKDVSLYKSNGFLYFPFNRDEIWLDELSDYKAGKNEKCPVGSYVL